MLCAGNRKSLYQSHGQQRLLGTSADVLVPVNPSIYKMDPKASLSPIS